MAERCAALRAAPLGSWDGVFVKNTKRGPKSPDDGCGSRPP
jgi:hypothetical protein